jgi:hypothetical protein
MPLALYRVDITETFPPREEGDAPRQQTHGAAIVADSEANAIEGAKAFVASLPAGSTKRDVASTAQLETHVAWAYIAGASIVMP